MCAVVEEVGGGGGGGCGTGNQINEMVWSTTASKRMMGGGVSVNVPVVPTYFQCPISLELMSDPVTLSTGHTYDRSSIQLWFHAGKNTCPQTRQEVSTKDLIPNVTLKNCIRSWQLATRVVTRNDLKFPTSPRLLNEQNVRLMLDDLMVVGSDRLETLKALRIMAKASDKNRRLIVDGGALPLLGSIISRGYKTSKDPCSSEQDDEEDETSVLLREEGLGALVAISRSEEIKRKMLPAVGLSNLPALSWFLHRGRPNAKIHAVRMVECLVADDDSLLQLGSAQELVQGLVGLLRQHELFPKAVRPSLRSLYAICLPRNNRSMAIEAGTVSEVLELLPGASKEIAEGALAILDLMSRCSEGRTALYRHALCIPIMVKSLVAYSNSGTEHSVKVLHSMLMNDLNPHLYKEAIKNGIIAKLLLVTQIHTNNLDTNLKTRELLKSLQVHCGADPCVRTIKYSR
ncbi:hypothetical protein Mapa_009494 [Marchantia paleacea]|nr:hypothetical protein Mapa_009494 [Marchantia paleacea]